MTARPRRTRPQSPRLAHSQGSTATGEQARSPHPSSAASASSPSPADTARELTIESMTEADWPAVARIYRAGIDAGDATFERGAPSFENWSRARLPAPRLVARGKPGDGSGDRSNEESGEVLGWAALSPVSARAVYRGVGAVSIYVDPAYTRRGVGRALLDALIAASEDVGLWTLEAGIFPENRASVALHERCGFTLVGVRRRLGQMADGRWRDVALYERRSRTIGG
jgi:L-amino acid N-acyltransferase YncA